MTPRPLVCGAASGPMRVNVAHPYIEDRPKAPPAAPKDPAWAFPSDPEATQETLDSTLMILAAIEWSPGDPLPW